MNAVLVLQLARFGDLLQTKRLIASLVASDLRVHLVVDSSLEALAGLVYPDVVVHSLPVHSRPDPEALRQALGALASQHFVEVYNLNFAGLSLSLTGMFDPATVRGYRLEAGQLHKDPWPAMAFRWTRHRRLGGLNLVDFWAGFTRPLFPPEAVNPPASPKGGGLGVVLAGRAARRSLPVDVLTAIIPAALSMVSVPRVFLLGAESERSAAKALMGRLQASTLGAVTDLTGRTGWSGLIDTLAGLDRVLTPDTGTMHLAAHLGTPVTAFFLSSAWCHETGPYGQGHTIWQAVRECAPCLEAAPCPHGVACLEPFRTRELLRMLTGKGRNAPPPGLIGFETGFDALGVVNRPVAGIDPSLAERGRFRAFLARHLGLAQGQDAPPAPDLAEQLVADPDFMLDKSQYPYDIFT